MKTNVLRNKCIVLVCALLTVAALVCGMLFVPFASVSARADDAESVGKVLYYIDAGNLSMSEDGLTPMTNRSGDTKYPCKVKTNFMTEYGLEFGTGDGTSYSGGLYNSVLDNEYGQDAATGKYWGITHSESGWRWWGLGMTKATEIVKDGFNRSRYAYEKDSEADNLQYKFQVDDTTTELRVFVGARMLADWADSADGKLIINAGTDGAVTSPISSKNENREYVFDNIYGIADGSDAFITLDFGDTTEKKCTCVSWILITTADYALTYDIQSFVKKGETSVQATPYGGGTPETITLAQEKRDAIVAAEYFDEVEISANIRGKTYTQNVTVIPEDTEYLVNVGGSAIGSLALADGAYDSAKGYGYTDGTDKNGNPSTGAANYATDAYNQSCRSDTTSLNYKFANLPQGAYGVIVGVVEHWSQWMTHSRAHTITANGGTGVALNCPDTNYVGGGTAPDPEVNGIPVHATCYGDVASNGELIVNIASADESVPTFILVYSVNKVSYDANGGLAVNDATYFDKGTTASLTATVPTRDDHEFAGWYTEVEGGTQVTDTVNASGTLYAHWTACEYGDPTDWQWTDFTAAQATLHCVHSGCEHTKQYDATITSHTTEASCEHGAGAEYVATITVGAASYTDAKVDATGSALGHAYDYTNIVWTWADDYSSATATVKCTRDESHVKSDDVVTVTSTVTKEATTEEAGVRTYTATIDGTDYKDVKTQEIPKLSGGNTGDNTGDNDSTGDNSGNATENTGNGKKSGCGSFAGGGHALTFAIIVLAAACGLLLVRKGKKA